jgi:hypothetical protein
MARPGGANYVIILKHELSGKRKSGEEHRRNSLLRHSLIAAAFALATITSSKLTGNAAPCERQRQSAPPHGCAPRLHLRTGAEPLLLGPVSWAGDPVPCGVLLLCSVVPTAGELVKGNRRGVGGVEGRLRRAGRHARAKIAALAHQAAYAATL